MIRNIPIRLLILSAAFLVGCCPCLIPGSSPRTRVAVYVDKGARNTGVYRWLELTASSAQLEPRPVDAEMIRKGALDEADMLVVPGGSSVTMAKTLGREGRERIRAFVAAGGGYIGTCAGTCLIMEPSKSHPDMIHLLPYRSIGVRGHADMMIAFNESAKDFGGIKAGRERIRYAHGPILVASDPVEDADFTAIATYDSNIDLDSKKKRETMVGKIACVAGTYGKGRVFALTVHPEYDPDDHHLLHRAFDFVTGRNDVTWTLPQRKAGQLAVGFVTVNSWGVETATFLQRLIRSGEFDLMPVNDVTVAAKTLNHLDALIAPDGGEFSEKGNVMLRKCRKPVATFLARGGRIVTWGKAAKAYANLGENVIVVNDGEAAVRELKTWCAQIGPVKGGTLQAAKTPSPIRAAVYTDKGGANYSVLETLALSPGFDVKVLGAKDIAGGALKDFDLLVQPGGGCNTQYQALGTNGVAEIERFVRNGGSYYGICAGAFLATQTCEEKKPRIGLVPFKDQCVGVYRGWGEVPLRMTEEGLNVFGHSVTNRDVIYWGGPVLVPGDPVPDSDVKPLATYNCSVFSTCSTNDIPSWYGCSALVGGRVGKGKVFISCPHPEKSELTYDMVLSGLEYLTGVRPEQLRRDRVPGAKSVLFKTAKDPRVAAYFAETFVRDRRLDVQFNSEFDDLSHFDAVVVMSMKREDLKNPKLLAFKARGGKVVVFDGRNFDTIIPTLEKELGL